MTGCTLGAIDQHRADWCLIRIGYGELFEPVIVHQFLACLFSQSCLGPGLDDTGGNERFLYKMPAF